MKPEREKSFLEQQADDYKRIFRRLGIERNGERIIYIVEKYGEKVKVNTEANINGKQSNSMGNRDIYGGKRF